jgi:hypothetical protein
MENFSLWQRGLSMIARLETKSRALAEECYMQLLGSAVALMGNIAVPIVFELLERQESAA